MSTEELYLRSIDEKVFYMPMKARLVIAVKFGGFSLLNVAILVKGVPGAEILVSVVALVFAAFAAAIVMATRRNRPNIKLSRDGITTTWLFAEQHVRWNEVLDIRVRRVGFKKQCEYQTVDHLSKASRLTRIKRDLSWYTLPTDFGLSADEWYAEIMRWRSDISVLGLTM